MTKKELINRLYDRTNNVMKIEIERLLDELSITAQNVLAAGETIEIPGIVKLATQERTPRKGRNPRTGEVIEIPGKTVVTAKPLKPLRDAVA